MAQAIRGTLAPKDFSLEPHAWMTLIAWCALSVIGAGLALRKRNWALTTLALWSGICEAARGPRFQR